MSPSSRPAWTPYAAALWALVFAVFHVIWALGWYVGLDPVESAIAFRRPSMLAYDLVVAVMCVVGFLAALALVRPWGRRVPPRVLGFLLRTGTALLGLRAVASVIQTAYLLAVGRFTYAVMGIWEPWFWLGALLFGITTWRYAPHRARHQEAVQ